MRKLTHQLDMEDAKFRSVYLPIVRDEEPRSLAVFDFADSSAIIGQRESSHTAGSSFVHAEQSVCYSAEPRNGRANKPSVQQRG